MTPILPFKRPSPRLQLLVTYVTLSSLIAQVAMAQPDACLSGVQTTMTTTAWQEIRAYFASLVESPAQRNKALLIRLRSNIVQLESEKQRLLDVIEAHARDGASGVGVGQDLALNQIPNILQRIKWISDEFKAMAQDANLFAAEPAFRQLVISLDVKRTATPG